MVKGRSYIFQNGEVSKDEEGGGELNISLPLTNITEQLKFLHSFVPTRMLRLIDIEKREGSHYYMEKAINLEDKPTAKKNEMINVCGIFQGLKDEPKIAKNMFRVIGIICDPDHLLAIHFVLLVDELTSIPSNGSVISLHNMTVENDEQTLHLESNRKSYFLN